jgi:hypothetical protein
MSAAVLEEQILEAQVESMMQRIGQKRSHDDIQRDVRRDQFELAKVFRTLAAERSGGESSEGGAVHASSGALLYLRLRKSLACARRLRRQSCTSSERPTTPSQHGKTSALATSLSTIGVEHCSTRASG